MSDVQLGQSFLNGLHRPLNTTHPLNNTWSYLSRIQPIYSVVVPVVAIGIGALCVFGMRSETFSDFLISIGLKANPIEKTKMASQGLERLLKNHGSGLENSWRNCFEGLPDCEQSVQRRLDKHNEEVQAVLSIKNAVQLYLNDKTQAQFEIEFPKDGKKEYPHGKKIYQSREDFFKATQVSGEIGQFINAQIKSYTPGEVGPFENENEKFLNYYPAGNTGNNNWWCNFWFRC